MAYDYTGADGVYSLSGLTAGTYYLRFAKTDYLPSYYNGRASLAEADGVSVTLGGVTGDINAALAEGGRISGHVTAEGTGAALKDVQVTIYNYIRVCGVLQLNYVASDTTDAAGDYTVTGLGTGNYLAHFGPLSNGSSAAYLDEYYNDRSQLQFSDYHRRHRRPDQRGHRCGPDEGRDHHGAGDRSGWRRAAGGSLRGCLHQPGRVGG